MKTRRKTTKTSTKGRRSSVICVKKSPINRRTTRRMLRSQTNCAPLFDYDSPLKSVRNNGPGSSTRSTSSRSTNKAAGNMKIDEDVELEDEVEEKKVDISNLSIKDEPVDEINENEVDMNSKFADSSAESSTTSKRKAKVDMLTALQNRKKRKTLKKSPLSKFKEPDDTLSESIIILDDSEPLPDTKTVLTESKENVSKTVNTFCQEVDQSIVKSEPLSTTSNSKSNTNSDEVVVLDCDLSFMEMEAYHDAFKQNENWSPINSNDNWSPPDLNTSWSSVNSNENWSPINSIIVIPDDDSPIQTRPTSPKPSEKCFAPIQTRPKTPNTNDDCFVVWSSLPSTSNADTQKPNTPIPNYNSNLLQHDKIFLDTNPDMGNLRFLNDENDKPKRSIKSRDTIKTKKSLLKSPKATKTGNKMTKAGTKTTKTAIKTTKTATATSKTATGTSKIPTATSKTATATSKTATATSKTATVTSKTATATSKTASATSNTATTTSKTATATSKTAVKKRTKNKGELIFLSESQEDGLAKKTKSKKGKLREIVIDGSNVAMAYTHNKMFSEKGIKMLIDYFTKRGHSVKVFVPQYRRSRNCPLLEKWYTDGIVVFTPSRKLGNKTFTPYDDRYILEYATARNGIVVSQDQFRDLYAEKPEYRDTIENRILVPTFVGDYVMFPEDPLGRDGPTLSEFLRH